MQRARPNAPHHNTARCGRHCPLPLSLLLLSAGLAIPLSAVGQTPPQPPQTAAASPDAIKQREQELEAARAEQNRAAESQAKLRDEIAAIGQDRSQLNQQLIDMAAQVRDLEDRMADAEARLNSLDSREQEIRSSLK